LQSIKTHNKTPSLRPVEQYMGDSTAKQIGSVKTIILVEDDTNIGEVLLQAITQETSYVAFLALSGEEALQMVKNRKPNLFILDYQLPQMNGIELYDQLHASPELNTVPTIMISAHLPQKELALRTAIHAMQKPIDLDEFLGMIEALLS
jgi:DNA-binding response OmpR family regulator